MKREHVLRAIAGSFILISLALSHYHSQNWLWFTAFVGINLLQSSFTRWCLMEDILAKFGIGDSESACCSTKKTQSDS
ncbi:MAG: DUF2892 domain-containing protein [Verrucomicrobiales bacterium]|nr:DUF2892 domain-containing protein [Verrucomicrobiales bacterium]